jgi:hypothetical protein
MLRIALFVVLIVPPCLGAQEKKRITPGKVVVPTDAMRRIWGELVSVDLKTRTGVFRNESNDELMPFTVMPYAELLHHAAFGDLQDFKVGERAIFRLHEDAAGKWTLLTYIQDEMNFLNGHKEYYHVDRLDPAKGEIEFTQANFDKSFVRGKGLLLEVDEHTRYWKGGVPAKFSDIRVGDRLRTKSHGIGRGKHHRCWDVFLDDVSLEKFQKEQQAVHSARLAKDGWPGFVDAVDGRTVQLTLFQEGRELGKRLKTGAAVRVAPADSARVPGASVPAKIVEQRPLGNLYQVSVALDANAPPTLTVTGLARLWLP